MMAMASRTWLLGICAALASVGAAGCSDPPENPGDPCDIEEDDCPAGLVCAAGGEEDVCQIPPGGGCSLGGPDHCLAEAKCVDDGKGAGVCVKTVAEGGACDPAKADVERCAEGLVCAEMTEGGHKCFAPVLLQGMVFDATSEVAIEGAHVLALNPVGTAVSDIALSDAAGNYSLAIAVPRDGSGAPVANVTHTLRASAADYQTFPGGLRTALPISSGLAAAGDKGWTIQAAVTDVALIPLPDGQKGLPSISGHVLAGDASGGVLVVAEGASGAGQAAISDLHGAYTVFNVPAGAYTVRGYAAGVQLDPATVDVKGAPLLDVDLAASDAALGTIAGSVNIVNAPGGSKTSVVLVVASTFDDTFARGEVPRGLRAPLSGEPSVTGAFQIDNVPEGSYLVLAAFENDGLVRDPDPNIAGTQIVTVSMPRPGDNVTLSSSFKVTEALKVFGPGASDPELVSAAPTLRWADDSGEDFYTVVVYNAYGELVWCQADAAQMPGCDGPSLPKVTGSGEVSVPYGGPLDPGMYYQFRASSWKTGGPISTTEDLLGVFFTEVP